MFNKLWIISINKKASKSKNLFVWRGSTDFKNCSLGPQTLASKKGLARLSISYWWYFSPCQSQSSSMSRSFCGRVKWSNPGLSQMLGGIRSVGHSLSSASLIISTLVLGSSMNFRGFSAACLKIKRPYTTHECTCSYSRFWTVNVAPKVGLSFLHSDFHSNKKVTPNTLTY